RGTVSRRWPSGRPALSPTYWPPRRRATIRLRAIPRVPGSTRSITPGVSTLFAIRKYYAPRHDCKPARPAFLAGRGPRARRVEGGARRRLEPRARRDQRAERQERPAAGAAVRRDRGLSEGIPGAHLQHQQPGAAVVDP